MIRQRPPIRSPRVLGEGLVSRSATLDRTSSSCRTQRASVTLDLLAVCPSRGCSRPPGPVPALTPAPPCTPPGRRSSAARSGNQPGTGRARHHARDCVQRLTSRGELWDGVEERFGVRVPGTTEEVHGGRLFDDLSGVHDHHVGGHVGDDAQIVGDEDHRHVLFALKCVQQSMICDCVVTSSAVVGSSAIKSLGEHDKAMAIMTRWRIPPEKACG